MIVRPRPHWFRMLFLWRGSVVKKLVPRLLIIFAIATLAMICHQRFRDSGYTDLNPQPFTLLGVALAIFLGFRNNVSYDRFWEARRLWGSLLNTSRALMRQALSLTSWQRESPQARQFGYSLCAFTHALRHQLRNSDANAELAALLPPTDLEAIRNLQFKPIAILQQLSMQLQQARQRGELSEMLTVAMEPNLNLLAETVGGCERIQNTPIPLTYSVLLHRTIYFYCVLLPFGLAPSIGWVTPIFSVFVAYTFMALEAIAEELEHPFGDDPNDLALTSMSLAIESTLREMLGEALPPPQPIPRDFIVL